MRFFISRFPCVIKSDELFLVEENIKYEIKEQKTYVECFDHLGGVPFLLNLNKPNDNVLKVELNNNSYTILCAQKSANHEAVNFRSHNQQISISISSELVIIVDGVIVVKQSVGLIEFSSFEEIGEFTFIYFSGKRKYFVVIKKKELICSDYYDEYNETEKEKYFMCKKFDCLNHGKVYCFQDNKSDSYLVYLDDLDLNLKSRFVASVFLDCLLVQNFKYCNELLTIDLKQENEKIISSFFPDFDDFLEIEEDVYVLFKKNTLAGIYKFDKINNQISNIMCLQ